MTETASVDTDSIRRELSVFGLSEKEIETYLTVLHHGEAKASTIAESADVSQRYVYNIARQLAERGLVQVNEHASPTTVRAHPPGEALRTLSDRLEALTPALEARFDATEPKTSQFQIVKSRQTAIKYIQQTLLSARDEAFVSIPATLFPAVQPELETVVDRGVLVLVLLSGAGAVDPDAFDGTASVVRRWDEDAPFMLTADNQRAIVGDAGLLSGVHADETAVALSQGHIAGSVLGSFIGSFWPAAEERYVSEPGPLPRTFESFRHVVLEAYRHRHAGDDVVVDVVTEDGLSLTGRVVGVRQSLVEPTTGDFPVENGLAVETGEGRVQVGGEGAFIEDYRAETVTLRTVD